MVGADAADYLQCLTTVSVDVETWEAKYVCPAWRLAVDRKLCGQRRAWWWSASSPTVSSCTAIGRLTACRVN